MNIKFARNKTEYNLLLLIHFFEISVILTGILTLLKLFN